MKFKIFFKNGDEGTIEIKNVNPQTYEMDVVEVKRKNKTIAKNCDGEIFYRGDIQNFDRKTGLKFGHRSYVTLDDKYYEDLKKTGDYRNPGEARCVSYVKFDSIGAIDITKNHKLLKSIYGE